MPLVFSKWENASMEIQATLLLSLIILLVYSTIQCTSPSRMFLVQDRACKTSKTDLLRKMVNSRMSTPSVSLSTIMTTLDSKTNSTTIKVSSQLLLSLSQVEVFHSTTMVPNKTTLVETIQTTESLSGKT